MCIYIYISKIIFSIFSLIVNFETAPWKLKWCPHEKKKKMLSTRPFNMQHAIPTAKVIIKQANQTSKSNKRDLLHETDNQGLKSHTTVHFIYNSCFHSLPNFLSGKNFLTTLYLQTNTTRTRKRKKKTLLVGIPWRQFQKR